VNDYLTKQLALKLELRYKKNLEQWIKTLINMKGGNKNGKTILTEVKRTGKGNA